MFVKKKSLHISCWNINGHKVKGFNKYSDSTFIWEIMNKDIICLLETHCTKQESLFLPNYKSIHLNRPKIEHVIKYLEVYQFL